MTQPLQQRAGVRLGVDVGSVRVGVAISDPDGILASPLATLVRDTDHESDIASLVGLVREHDAVEVVVGRPLHLSGAAGRAVAEASAYAERLATLVAPVPVRLVDERLSTVSAERALRQGGMPRAVRRGVVDQVAAAVVLQGVLDALPRRERR